MANPRILIAEDEDTLRDTMHAVLRESGYETHAVSNAEQAVEIHQRSPVDLIITDLYLPGASGIELLKTARCICRDTTVIVMTAFGTIHGAVEAMKVGAYDYLTKPIHPYELTALVSRTLEHRKLKDEVALLRSCLEKKQGFENIIGSSASLMSTLDIAARVATSDVTVLLQGETGTGKELIAKAIHVRSPRRDRPFVVINCGSIPRELLESELFGHVKGSFTGAVSHKKGRVEVAEGGTILLDEIGEMPLELQVRVLRWIQEREIEKIGATAPIRLDVRIIAATHRDLGAMIRAGTFREDLYYRLMVLPIELPPLRNRLEDLPFLVQQFFGRFKDKHSRQELTFPPRLLPYFRSYQWPGNIRQLQNVVERAVLLATGSEITLQDLPAFLQFAGRPAQGIQTVLPDTGVNLCTLEKDLIMQALQKFHGNQSRAARFLQITRRTLSYRTEKYGISAADFAHTSKETGT